MTDASTNDQPSGGTLRLGVLDQSPVPEGSTSADALRNTLDLARLADELGYHRYWVAEHHGTPGLAGPTPPWPRGPGPGGACAPGGGGGGAASASAAAA